MSIDSIKSRTGVTRIVWVKVLVIDCPVNKLFTYESDPSVRIGDVVNIPFGRQDTHGVVMGFDPNTKIKNTRPIGKVILSLGAEYLEFIKKVAIYYCTPLQTMIKTALPPGIFTKKTKYLDRQVNFSFPVTEERDLPKTLNPEQAEALKQIKSTESGLLLLYGVTGSGKTETYLQAVESVLAQGKTALVLVPEIGLTPQTIDQFRKRFGDEIALYHSAMTGAVRCDNWMATLLGKARLVIGTRSAVFAPLKNIGLIILDEEHDSSYKQDEPTPCYDARTIAKMRGKEFNCPVVFGSATPSAVTWGAKEKLLTLPNRVQSRALPTIEVVDMREELRTKNFSIFSRRLQEELENLSGKAILFIHRRGHSTFVSCRTCGYVEQCPRCDVSLKYHDDGNLLRCHYCGFNKPSPKKCPKCSSNSFKFFGSGSQKVEEELNQLFPDLKAIRYDGDIVKKTEHKKVIADFKENYRVLVGTQILSQGLDIPEVELVGIISADGLLNLGDYNSQERAFSLLTQVAGRSGRGDIPGKVILQTYSPDHPVIQGIENHQYTDFIEKELEQRESSYYPPFCKLGLIRISSENEKLAESSATKLTKMLIDRLDTGFDILGPAPAQIGRVNKRFYWHILIKTNPGQNFAAIRDQCESPVFNSQDIRITVNIDA